ncbi:head-tail connector protein, partial [Longimicrobium sp.]|uniref:head-tail connector protein n=1 Tax=Longimicrobium sp. TaxID=2029185 RepID=UPI002F92CB8E
KAHLRVTDDSEDELIAGLITAAREVVEGRTWLALPIRTVEYTTDAFPSRGFIELPYPPLVSVESVTYVDAAGVEQTLGGSVYEMDAASRPGRVRLAYGQSWPAVRHGGSVVVRYVAGFALGAEPGALVQAMLLLIGQLYENRENGSIPAAVQSMCRLHALPKVG